MKPSSAFCLSCSCALAYTPSLFAAETSTDMSVEAPAAEGSGLLPEATEGEASASDPTADSDNALGHEHASAEREAKNAIYLDLLGPGLFYSINYDRILSEDISARIGLSYLSFGASASDSSGTTSASAEFSYWAVPLTVSYLGIGSETNMLELGGGAVIMNVKGSGVVETDDTSQDAAASATLFAATGMIGYRRQPADGGFVFRIGASPVMTFGAGFLPWGYLSLGAAF